MVGVILILARLLRLGFLANFLSRAVLIGFLTGVGIQVAMGQLHGVLGVSDGSGHDRPEVHHDPPEHPRDEPLGPRHLDRGVGPHPRLRAHQPAHPGRPHRGHPDDRAQLPRRLPEHGLAARRRARRAAAARACRRASSTRRTSSLLLPTALSCFIIILAQSAATSRAYAIKYEDSFDENVDLIGLSVANLGAGLSRHVRGQRQPDQDPDGRRRGRQDPARPAGRRRVRGARPALPDAGPAIHAERRAGRGRPAHRPQAHRHRGHARHRAGPVGRVRGRRS